VGFNDKFDDQENQPSGETQGSDQELVRTHSLGDAGIDAGTVDVTPATDAPTTPVAIACAANRSTSLSQQQC
jgi:hypothetical protein